MQENVEVNNPMYIQDDIDDDDIHLDRAFPLQEKVRHVKVFERFELIPTYSCSLVEISETQCMTLCTVLVVVHQ